MSLWHTREQPFLSPSILYIGAITNELVFVQSVTSRPLFLANSPSLSSLFWLFWASDHEPEAVYNPLCNALTSNLS